MYLTVQNYTFAPYHKISMAGRPKIFEEKVVVDKAIEVFWRKGYESASATELLEAMNIGKGSFYLAFKEGKKELYLKSLEQFSNNAIDQFHKALSQSEDPISFLKDFFIALGDSPKTTKSMGCYLGNAMVEMSNVDSQTKEKAAQLLSKLEKGFENIIREAQQNNLISTKAAPEVLARHLINLWNGIHITHRMHPLDSSEDHRPDNCTKEMIELNLQILQ